MGDESKKLDSILSTNRLGTFIQGISLYKLHGIANSLKDLTGQSNTLTTSFEAQLVEANKTTTHIGARYGMLGKDLRKFSSQATGMALSLNVSNEKAAESVMAWTNEQKTLSAVGLKSSKDLAKFTEVADVNAYEFSRNLSQFHKLFEGNDDALRTFTESMIGFGRESQDLTGALNNMGPVLDFTRRKFAATGMTLKPEELANYSAQIFQVSTAFTKMGHSADESREMAFGLTENIVASGENLTGMFAGVREDIDGFAKEMGVVGGDFQAGFKLIQEGPAGFMAGFAKMVQAAKKDGRVGGEAMAFLQSRISEAIGDPTKAANIVSFFGKVDESTLQAMTTTDKWSNSLRKLSKEYRSGRTDAEKFQLIQDQFIKTIRGPAKGAVEKFLASSATTFQKFGKQIAGLAKDKGPMGQTIKKMMEMSHMGAKALLPANLQPIAAMLETVGEQAGLLGQVTTVIGLWPVLKEELRTAWDKMKPELEKLWKEQIYPGILAGWEWVKGKLGAYLSEWWGKVSKIWGDKSKPLWDRVKEIFGESGPILAVAIPALWLFSGPLNMILSTFGLLTSSVGILGGALKGIGGVISTVISPSFLAGLKTIGTSISALVTSPPFLALLAGIAAYKLAKALGADQAGEWVGDTAHEWFGESPLSKRRREEKELADAQKSADALWASGEGDKKMKESFARAAAVPAVAPTPPVTTTAGAVAAATSGDLAAIVNMPLWYKTGLEPLMRQLIAVTGGGAGVRGAGSRAGGSPPRQNGTSGGTVTGNPGGMGG